MKKLRDIIPLDESIKKMDYPLTHRMMNNSVQSGGWEPHNGTEEVPAKSRKAWAQSEADLKAAGHDTPEKCDSAHEKFCEHYYDEEGGVKDEDDYSGHKAAKEAGIPKSTHSLIGKEVWGND